MRVLLVRGISSGRVAQQGRRIVDGQLDVRWLRDMDVLGTVDVDGGTWGWQEAFHRLQDLLCDLRFSWSLVSSGIWVVLLDPLLHKD